MPNVIEGNFRTTPPARVEGVDPQESIADQLFQIYGLGVYKVSPGPLGGNAFLATRLQGGIVEHEPEKIVLKSAVFSSSALDIPIDRAAFVRQYEAIQFMANQPRALVPRALGFVEVDHDPNAGVYFATEYFGVADLSDFVQQCDIQKPQDRLRILQVFRSLVEQVQIAQSLGYINRDIKMSNIRLMIDEKVGITDWGSVYRIAEPFDWYQKSIISYGYTAPEARSINHLPGVTDDVFTLGMTLFAMLIKSDPDDELILSLDPMPGKVSALQGTIIDHAPRALQQLMYGMTVLQEDCRIRSLTEVMHGLDNAIALGQY